MERDRRGWLGPVLALVLAAVVLAPAPVRALDAPERGQMVAWLRAGELRRLERWLEAYQSAFENHRAPEDLVVRAFRDFADSDPALRESLDGWIERYPDSWAALTARGAYYGHLAWITSIDEPARAADWPGADARRGFADLAESDLKRALTMKPGLSPAYAFLIRLHVLFGNRAEEDFTVQRGLDAVPGSLCIRESHLFALLPLWRPRNLRSALSDMATFIENVRRDSRRFPVLKPLLGYDDFAAGLVLMDDGKRKQAEPYFRRALEQGDYWLYRLIWGINYALAGHAVLALQQFDAALRLGGDATILHFWRARVRRGQGDYRGALDELDQGIALDAMHPDLWLARGQVLSGYMGRNDEALAAYDKAMLYGAYDHRVRGARGHLLARRLGRFKDALEDLDMATRLKDDEPDYWRDYGAALSETGSCDAISALATYTRLCRRQGGCDAADVARAKRISERVSHQDCD